MLLEGIIEVKYVDYDLVENMVYWLDVYYGGFIFWVMFCVEGWYFVNVFMVCIVKFV